MTKYTAQSQLSNLDYRQMQLTEETVYLLRELIDDEVTFEKPIRDDQTLITGINSNDVICDVKGFKVIYPIEEIDFNVAVRIIEELIKNLHN